MISVGRGVLVKNTSHGRDRDEKIDNLLNSVNMLFDYEASDYLSNIRHKNPRYARDQLKLIETLCSKYGIERTLEAIQACEGMNLISATYVRDYLKYAHPEPALVPIPKGIILDDLKYRITVEKRPIEVYVKAGGAQ
jgi:hypothetical protein